MVKVFTVSGIVMLVVSGCTTAPTENKSDVAIVAPTADPVSNTGVVYSSDNVVVESADGCVRSAAWSDDLSSCDGKPEIVIQAVVPTPVVKKLPAIAEISEPKEPVFVRETLNGNALFEVDSAELSPEGYRALEDLVGRIGEVAGAGSIEIVGHTDDSGSEEYNQRLSAERAQMVRKFLEGKISGMRISSSAQGELSPVADNSTKEGRAKNRRVEVLVSRRKIAE